MGHPCLLTTQWEAVPLAELVNLVGTYVNPNLYYVVTDCCAIDRTSPDVVETNANCQKTYFTK